MAAFEDLCRELFDAADERFLIDDEQLVVNAYSLDRQYTLSCEMADEVEGSWEGSVDVQLSSDAANAAASLYLDIFDERGQPMEAAWECLVRWNAPPVSDPNVGLTAGGDIAQSAGVPVEDVTVHASSVNDGDRWVYHLSFEYALWLADDDDPDEDAARIMAIAEDGLNRLQELAKHWPVVEGLPDDDES
jgi:hypothetical protein